MSSPYYLYYSRSFYTLSTSYRASYNGGDRTSTSYNGGGRTSASYNGGGRSSASWNLRMKSGKLFI